MQSVRLQEKELNESGQNFIELKIKKFTVDLKVENTIF